MDDGALRSLRIDWKMEVISFDEATGRVETRLVPNPDRYEWRTMDDGQEYLYDRMDDVYLSKECLAQAAAQMARMPICFERQRIDSAADYVAERREAIALMLGEPPPRPAGDGTTPVDPLATLRDTSHEFAVLSVDLVGSTRLANDLAPTDYVRLMTAALYEMTALIPLFNGHVLKMTGDGLIAYFAAPSFNRKNDFSFDCARTMLLLVSDALNPGLVQHGLPEVAIRIGIESGAVPVCAVGSPEAGEQPDLIGLVVSMAAKVQSLAAPGEIALGGNCLRHLHTSWRSLCQAMVTPSDWPYRGPDGQPYRVFVCSGLRPDAEPGCGKGSSTAPAEGH